MIDSRGGRCQAFLNENGYEKAAVLSHLEGIVDIYLGDLKYFSATLSRRLSGASDYYIQAAEAIKEMACQQPALVLDERGVARRGLIVRHLVLPGQLEDTLAILGRLAEELDPTVALSLMSQYHPRFRPPEDMNKLLPEEEYRQALSAAEELGFECLFVQPDSFAPDEHLFPDFNRPEPFQWSGRRDKG